MSDRHRELIDLLSEARRRVHRAGVAAQFPVAMRRAATAVAAVAAVFAASRAAGRLVGVSSFGFGWSVPALAAVLGVLIAAGYTLIAAYRRFPTVQEAAERLDLSTADHNRIAIALALLEGEQTGMFVQAAIDDGFAHAQRLKDAEPHADPPPCGLMGARNAVVVLAIAVALAALVGLPSPVGNPASLAMVPMALTAPDRRAAQPLDEKRADPQSRPSTPGEVSSDRSRRQAAAVPAGKLRQVAKSHASAGRSGGGATANAGASNQSDTARGDSSESPSRSRTPEKKEPAPNRSKPSKESPLTGSKGPKTNEDESSISQGFSGGGAMSPVQNDWSQRSQSTETDQENEDTDQPTDNDNESNTQRGGVQPSLKDRQAAPSRELGISSDDEGPPGTGRGGPTPPKKSRGTASLVLGVPVPDFVKGRLGPGNTKITHERVDPAAIPGDPVVAAPARPRSGPEASCPIFDMTADVAAIARDYLIRLHSTDQEQPAGQPDLQPTGAKP